MVELKITYCQPCGHQPSGHQPRAVEMVNQLLGAYGMPLNKKLKISLIPSDHGVFDVVLDGKLVFSRQKAGRFPTVEESRKEIEPKLTVPLQA